MRKFAVCVAIAAIVLCCLFICGSMALGAQGTKAVWDEWNERHPVFDYWRGSAGVKYQSGWHFSFRPDVSEPDVLALGPVLDYTMGLPWKPAYTPYAEDSGVIHIGIMLFNAGDQLNFSVPNVYVGDKIEKTVRLTLTYSSAAGEPEGFTYCGSWFNALGSWDDEIRTFTPEEIELGDALQEGSWVTRTFEFTTWSDPFYEHLLVDFGGHPFYIDSAILETVIVPEPATLFMLALSACPILLARRAAQRGRGGQ